MKTPLHILQKIEANRVKQEKILSLRGENLLSIPPEVLDLTHLEELWLNGNAIQTLPSGLDSLPKLRILDLRQNPLHELGGNHGLVLDWGAYKRLAPAPEQVAGLWLLWTSDDIIKELLRLPDLIQLDISHNRFEKVPKAVFELQNLSSLNLSRNGLNTLPEWLFNLQNLTSLDLSYNGLSSLPEGLFNLKKLTSLNLRNNALSALPEGLFDLENLISLNLRDNGLRTLSEGVFNLQKLTSLNLRYNDLSTLPASLFKLQNLTSLYLRNNGLGMLPEALFGLQNLTSLDLSGNGLSTLPKGLFKLQNLISLDLSKNGLNTLPDDLFNLQNLTSLYLGGNGLSTLSDCLFKLPKLSSLYLWNNKLTMLPASFFKQQNLSSLDLSNNGLSTLPADLFNLQNLTSLNLSNNGLNTLPKEFFKLKNLVSLDLSYNGLSALPEDLFNLENLTSLNLGGNNLSSLPKNLFNLQNLSSLDLWHNGLTILPEGLFALQNLTSLDLRDNGLNTLPEGLFNLQNLVSLDLWNNSLRSLPEGILKLQNLRSLYAGGNLIENPPLEILDIKETWDSANLLKLHAYFRQHAEQGTGKIYEAKLIIVGEGGAGKTSLARRILDPKKPLPGPKESTEGIDVLRWDFRSEGGEKFRVNIWDFGGQEIYHATHQFFLSKRSLYVLVADTRRDDTDFYYWLNVVELLSDQSPVLIVKNEKNDRLVELGKSALRERFTSLKDSYSANVATCRGLDDIKDAMCHYLTHLPHVGSSLPKTWVKVRAELESDPRTHITLNEYLDICTKHGFKRHEDKRQLSDYLHDLGVCLHFQDDDLLKNTVILKPEWGTGAVYKVLDNDSIKRNDGCFARDDLAEIWQEETDMHGELLRLMMKFSLCYELPGGGQYIAPQLLPKKAKIYSWNAQDNLLLRYTYTFMPKGILSRFIVTMHSDIEDQRVWRHGVVLAKDGARAEVIENYQEREIRIRVAGANQRDLLTIIAEHLERIHASFHQLRYERLIPCRCAQCETEPYFYSYQILKRFAADRQEYIQCQKSYIMVDVYGLLDEVRDKRAASQEKPSFDFTQKHKLVERLLACPSIRNTQTRQTLAEELPPHIANTVKASDNSRVYVLNIINACMNHADGLDRLFDIVEFFDGQTVQFKSLMQEIVEISPGYAQAKHMLPLNLDSKHHFEMFGKDTAGRVQDNAQLNRALYHKIKNTIAVLKEIIYDKLADSEDPVLQGLADKIDAIFAGIKARRAEESVQTGKLGKSDYAALLKIISDTAHNIVDFVGNKTGDMREELWEQQADLAPDDPYRALYQDLLQHLQRTLAALNDLKAVNEGVIRLKQSAVALQDLFATWLATPALRKAQIRVHLNEPARLILTDVRKVQGFLDELVENSLKHNPRHTDLTIDLSAEVQLGLYLHNHGTTVKIPGQSQHLHVRVCDNGKGVPSNKKEWIFQPLATTAPGDEGSGLGLFGIRRTLAEMHGFVEETGTNGVHFDIYIPLEDV